MFPTSVVSFAAYVVNVKASVAGESQTAAHSDIVFPLLPTALASCSTAAGDGSSFLFMATTAHQGALATGVGTPTTAQVRVLRDDLTGATLATHVYLHTAKTGAPLVTATCTMANPGAIDFGCGN